MSDLTTKQEYQEALELIEIELDKAIDRLNRDKSKKRELLSRHINLIARAELHSKEAQEAYVTANTQTEDASVTYDNFDKHKEACNKLIRQRENVLKLMSYDQSEMKLI